MRRASLLLRALLGRGVSRSRADSQPVPAELVERLLQIFPQVVRERTQRRGIDRDDSVRQFAPVPGLREKIKYREKCRQSFAAAGRGGEQERVARENLGD